MLKCNNGFNTAQNFDELASLLTWNFKSWDEKMLNAIRAMPSRGYWANSGGPVHARVELIPERKTDENKELVLLQNKIFAPHPGSPDCVFADLGMDLYYYRNLETPDPNFTLSDTMNSVVVYRKEIETNIHRSLDQLEWLFFSRGYATFGFHSSLFIREKNEAYLATLPPAILIENEKLLKINVQFSYPNVEEII